MKDQRYRIGVAASAIWVCVAVGFVVWKGPADKINEWGDFFAGFAAPLAFLWLVLGYLQQGQEMRAQAEELKQSVDAQRALAAATAEQNELERKRFEEATTPHLVFNPSWITDEGQSIHLNMTVVAARAPAYRVEFEFEALAPQTFAPTLPAVIPGLPTNFVLRLAKATFEGSKVVVSYCDSVGRSRSETFVVTVIMTEPQPTAHLVSAG